MSVWNIKQRKKHHLQTTRKYNYYDSVHELEHENTRVYMYCVYMHTCVYVERWSWNVEGE